MAQQFHSLNLKDAQFPMLSEQQTRTTIPTRAGQADPPSVAYCHNVMPSKEGFDSVALTEVVTAIVPAVNNLIDVRVVFGDKRTRLCLAWDIIGTLYSLLPGATTWITLPETVPATGGIDFDPNDVTIGKVNGISHIFYSKIGSFTYDESIDELVAETLTGLDISKVLGVAGTSGYLVAFTDNDIAWSSTIDPTDFIPSQVTGSGGGKIADISGPIIFVTPNTLGLIVYSFANSVAATYTGNVQFPFKFREIPDSKGGLSLDLVAYEANSDVQFVYSKGGVQTITSQIAKTILPEVTDFLSGKRFEDYDTVTNTYIRTNLIGTLKKKIKFIASRYLVISYGITEFTHALIFDVALERLGKIRFTHRDVFEFVGEQVEIAKETIAFVDKTGVVSFVDFSTDAVATGVLVLGKVQLERSRGLELLGVEVENVAEGSSLDIFDQASLDGKTFTVVQGAQASSAENIREYVFRVTAKNHSLVFIGTFNLVTAQVRYIRGGRR